MADSRPLQLLMAGSTWPPETFLEHLIRGLVGAGLQVTVAIGNKPNRDRFAGSGIRFLRTAAWNGSIPLQALRLAGSWGRAMILARREVRLMWPQVRKAGGRISRLRTWYRLLPFVGRHWDVIYFPWNSAAAAYLPLFELGRPAVVSCRGSQINIAPHGPRRAAFREVLRATFQKAAAVHCVSEAILREAVGYGLDSTKAVVIRPAVDSDFFRPAEQPRAEDGTFRVVTTGLLDWRKGHEYALLAIRRLVEVGVPVRLFIIGEGRERQRILYTIHDLGLAGDVHLLGRLTAEKVRDQLQRADVFLLSSLSEGLCNAALEAMACGLPVVTTDCGGMPEAITNGVEGFLVPLRDPEGMAKALSALASDVKLRRRMGKAGRDRVLGQFTLRRQIEEFVSLLEVVARCRVG